MKDEPRLRNKRWSGDEIRGKTSSILAPCIFAIVFCGIGGAIVFFKLKHDNDMSMSMHMIILIASPFFLIGIGCFIGTLVAILRRIKFGVSTLELASFPVPIGGQLVGVIHTGHKLPHAHGYHLKLQCIRCENHNDIPSDIVLWEDEATVPHGVHNRDTSHTAIPVGFRIPADSLPSLGNIYWKLEACAKMPGLKYRATFQVPVYRRAVPIYRSTDDSSGQFSQEQLLQVDHPPSTHP
ncbi:MAG: hypothetical protein FWD61_08285 [Phycisphaerales bacterium]|nr:hypothetical protein [Phycisphaerales bacterium]